MLLKKKLGPIPALESIDPEGYGSAFVNLQKLRVDRAEAEALDRELRGTPGELTKAERRQLESEALVVGGSPSTAVLEKQQAITRAQGAAKRMRVLDGAINQQARVVETLKAKVAAKVLAERQSERDENSLRLARAICELALAGIADRALRVTYDRAGLSRHSVPLDFLQFPPGAHWSPGFGRLLSKNFVDDTLWHIGQCVPAIAKEIESMRNELGRAFAGVAGE
jgi:hypothetical protein